MAKQRKTNLRKVEEPEKITKINKAQPLYGQLKTCDEGIVDSIPEPLAAGDARLLLENHFSGQGAQLITRLQQSRGNKYVQNLVRKTDAKPLAPEVRSEMEMIFGKSLGNVKVLEGDGVAEPTGRLAVTRGETIHFAPGKYAPETEAGRQVLGHELAHVIQQTKGEKTVATHEELESEAQQASYKVIAGRPTTISLAASFGRPQGAETEIQPVTVAAVVKARDLEGVFKLTENQIRSASMEHRLSLIGLILKQEWVGPNDEYKIEEIWRTFPREELEQVLEIHGVLDFWKKCIERGAELDKLPVVKAIKASFKTDVKAIAQSYLDANRNYAVDEMKRVGISWGAMGGAETTIFRQPTQEQSGRLASIQRVAQQVWISEQVLQALRGIPVGWEYRTEVKGGLATEGKYTVKFDPRQRPERPADDRPDWPSWAAVLAQHNQLNEVVASYCTRYPTIYGLYRDKRIADLATAGDAQSAQRVIAETLQNLLSNIDKTKEKLAGDSLNYLDLIPVHDQLLNGRAPLQRSVVTWPKALPRWVAQEEVKGHEDAQFWLSIGLSSLTAALFVVASITTGGLAAAFFAAGGAFSAAQPIMSWDKYLGLAKAAESTLTKEMSLVSEEQVRGALVGAVLDTAFAFLDLYGAGKGIATALRAGRVPVIREALVAGEEAARAAKAAIPDEILLNKAGAKELVERAVAELGVSEALKRTGATLEEMLVLVGRDSPAGKAIKTYGKKVAKLAAVPITFTAEEIPLRLVDLSALVAKEGRDAADKLVLQSIQRFGRNRTLEMAGGWEKLSASLGKGTASGAQLEAWRASLYADLEKYMGGGVRRTGTPGFMSDLDITLLGESAAANRHKAMSFLAGRADTSPDNLKKILFCDMFTDSRRLHLYDVLPQAARETLSKKQAEFEQQLIWNKRLYEAGWGTAEKGSIQEAQAITIRAQMTALGVEAAPFKPLNRAQIATLNNEIENLHKQLNKALAGGGEVTPARLAEQTKLIEDIARRQAMVNASEGGGYIGSGQTRRMVSERPGEKIPPLKENLTALRAEQVTAVLDEMVWLDKEYLKLMDEATNLARGSKVDPPKVVEALKKIGKHGDRLVKVVRERFKTTIPDLPDFDIMGGAFESLIKKARAGDLHREVLTNEVNTLVRRAEKALNQLEQSSVTLQRLLREHAELGSTLRGFEATKRMIILHSKLLVAKDEIYKLLPTLLLQYIVQYAQSEGAAGK